MHDPNVPGIPIHTCKSSSVQYRTILITPCASCQYVTVLCATIFSLPVSSYPAGPFLSITVNYATLLYTPAISTFAEPCFHILAIPASTLRYSRSRSLQCGPILPFRYLLYIELHKVTLQNSPSIPAQTILFQFFVNFFCKNSGS